MKTSDAGIALIKQCEGCELNAYQDSVGVWTIGYGHTRQVKPGQKIDAALADTLLRVDLSSAEADVMRLVKVPLNDNRFAACVSLVFNIGADAFAHSTLLRKINAWDFAGAGAEFLRWNHAGGKVLEGLTARRQQEKALWDKLPY